MNITPQLNDLPPSLISILFTNRWVTCNHAFKFQRNFISISKAIQMGGGGITQNFLGTNHDGPESVIAFLQGVSKKIDNFQMFSGVEI